MIKTSISMEALPADAANDTTTTAASTLARLYGPLRTRALLLTQCPNEADDLVQQVVERALNHPAVFGAEHNTWGWLTRVMRNLFLDECRRRRVRQTVPVEAELLAYPEVDDRPSCHDLLSTEDLQGAMAGLSESQRALIQLAHLSGRSYREIASQLGVSCNTIGTRLLRARRRLKTLLQSACCEKLQQLQSERAANPDPSNGGIRT